jgi:class 3 adenylate cyclase
MATSLTQLHRDIVGFTAWSSVREPCQVFTLLETVYHAFDEIAKRRRVFKVETVGDCYVAVVGLPEVRHDHAVVMARFARDCMLRMWTLTKKLETSLGPDTGDLTMRMGLHSGPVTAGVLRGERSRFQLFGDTMNTCARMESNGKKSKIHISEETANLLINVGKGAWVKPREDAIYAKGKGELKTFWLDIIEKSEHGSNDEGDDANTKNMIENDTDGPLNGKATPTGGKLSDKAMRLVCWNVEVMVRLLKQVVARRRATGRKVGSIIVDESILLPSHGGMVLDEVKEIITLPTFDAKVAEKQQNTNEVQLDPAVVQQLNDYVMKIAGMYRDNPFHNFEHASHVTMVR